MNTMSLKLDCYFKNHIKYERDYVIYMDENINHNIIHLNLNWIFEKKQLRIKKYGLNFEKKDWNFKNTVEDFRK